MSPVLEIIYFPASQAYIENQEVIKPALEALRESAKPLKVYYGLQFEDRQTGYVAIIWESQESVANASSRTGFEEKSKSIVNDPITSLQFGLDAYDTDATKALEAPVTEFAIARLKREENRDSYNKTTVSLFKKLESGEGCYGPVYGQVSEGPGDVVISIGWDSPQTHADAVKDEPGVLKLFELADLIVVHTPFKAL